MGMRTGEPESHNILAVYPIFRFGDSILKNLPCLRGWEVVHHLAGRWHICNDYPWGNL